MKKIFIAAAITILLTFLFAQNSNAQQQSAGIWQDVSESVVPSGQQRLIIPRFYRVLALQIDALRVVFNQAPMEFSELAKTREVLLSLPLPGGTFQSFRIAESPIMAPELAAKFPDIRTFSGQGVDDRASTCRLDVTSVGFHAIIFTPNGTIYIDPYSRGNITHYIAYFKRDAQWNSSRGVGPEPCYLEFDPVIARQIASLIEQGLTEAIGEQLRTYRAAVAATGEYTQFHGGTVALGLAAVVTAMNRVNGIYEREVSVRMTLIANNNTVIYTNPATDPYTNNDGVAMLGQNQTNLDNVIGSGNYDIGHVFSTGGGGVASLGVVCRAGLKARGVTGRPSPIGDPFYVDYVAHEIGHQFGANHSFNGNESNCGGSNRNAATAYEPGSGSTIMAYAGICGSQDLQPNSDDYFHRQSIDEIVAYSTAGSGNTCPTITSTGNSAPVVNAGPGGYTIPIGTPFSLTGSASDPNGDALTYCWEEFDLGPAGHPNSPSGNAPIFRSFLSVSSPSRTFPKLSNLLNNSQTIGEILPSYTRTLNYRLTARDNRTGGGGNAFATLSLNVTANAGPFLVTAPNTAVTWTAGSTQTVTWNVANTNVAPVSCTQVKILLSTDGGNTFLVALASSTPNDGTENIIVPSVGTSQARVKVEAISNVFFDISNANFTIVLPIVQVSIDQRNELNQSLTGTSVGRWEGGPTFSNLTIPINPFQRQVGSHEILKGQQDFAYTPATEKYNTWKKNDVVDPNVQNHHDFTVLGTSLFVSQFKSIQDATLQAQLIDGGSTGGALIFKDPWYPDFNEPPYPGYRNRGLDPLVEYSIPYAQNNIGINTNFKGVFLNQPIVSGQPYYSVGAPNPNYINSFESYFQNWEGSNVSYQYPTADQTGVVFTASGATATAKYKAKLASSVSNATSSNSQRIVTGFSASGVPDIYYMVYPSAGELWWINSDDAGAYWWYDTRLTNSSGTASAPSMALWIDCSGAQPNEPCHMEPYVVYRKQSGSDYNIMFTTFTTEVPNPIQTATQINSTAIPTSIDARPVIARLDLENGEYKILWAFWQSTDGIHGNWAQTDGSTWYWLGEFGGLAANTRNPSISSPDLTAQTPNWYLTYDNANNVLITDYNGTFYDTAIPASVSPTSYSSQVCADNRSGEQVHVVWEAYGVEEQSTDGGDSWEGGDAVPQQRRVMYQNWNGSQWLPAHEFRGYYSSINYYRPTISNLSNGNLAWAWDDGSSTYKALHDGSSWTVTETYPNSTQPNLAISASHGPIGSTRFVSTSTSGSPYRLNVGAETTAPIDGPQASILPEQYSRRVVVARKPLQRNGRFRHSMSPDGPIDRDSSYLSVELAPISLKMRDGSIVPVDFAAVGDSVMDERTIWESLVSAPITLSSAIDSIIVSGETEANTPLVLGGTEIGLSFDVVDADHGTVLKKIGSERVFRNSGAQFLNHRERLSGLAGRRVFLRPSVRGFAGRAANLISTLVHVHTLITDSTSGPTTPLAKASESPAALPTTFALHQNYPNPFNPTTEIRFDLPDAGIVSLVVYDVLGKKVADLANGYRGAGYHSATWNASDAASGVYFARFSITNSEGRLTYSKINKLVLMK